MPLRFKRFERIRSHFAFRFTKVGVVVLAITLAVAIVATLTVDLGPGLRGLAEREGSKRVGRPMHIGRLGVRLFNGKFVLEDFVIEGLVPADRPFLRAKRIDVSLAWEALFRREVLVDSIEMTDWQMVLEQWAGGKHSFPKFNMGGGSGPRRFVTTMQYVRTRNGTVTFDDHGSRWGTVARNLDITVTKFAGYRGEANFHGGTVWIQDYVPMSMSMKSVFRVEEGIVQFERMNAAHRRRRVDHHRRRRHQELAGDDLQGEVDRRLQADAGAVLREGQLHAVRRGTLQRSLPSLQGRPRAHGRFRERRRGAADWRPRLRVPQA